MNIEINNPQLKADILTNKVDGSTSIIRHGRLSFESSFDIQRIEYCDVSLDKTELLEINKPEVGKIYIVHQYCLDIKANIGRFMEFTDLNAAREIFKKIFNDDGEEWYYKAKKNENVKKYVRYTDPLVPWFYSKDRKIKENVFVPEII